MFMNINCFTSHDRGLQQHVEQKSSQKTDSSLTSLSKTNLDSFSEPVVELRRREFMQISVRLDCVRFKPNNTEWTAEKKIRTEKTDWSCWQRQKRHSPSEEEDGVNLLKQTSASCNINVKSCGGNSADCWQREGLSSCLADRLQDSCMCGGITQLAAGLAVRSAEVGIILYGIITALSQDLNIKSSRFTRAALYRFTRVYHSVSMSVLHSFLWQKGKYESLW